MHEVMFLYTNLIAISYGSMSFHQAIHMLGHFSIKTGTRGVCLDELFNLGPVVQSWIIALIRCPIPMPVIPTLWTHLCMEVKLILYNTIL
jgi:hypothetical protein